MLSPPDEGTQERCVYDALHAEWHHPECPAECGEFLFEWHEGREFTSADLVVVLQAANAWVAEQDDEPEPAAMPGFPPPAGTKITRGGVSYPATITGTRTSGGYHSTTTATGTTSTWPVPPGPVPAAVPTKKVTATKATRVGDRKGRADGGIVPAMRYDPEKFKVFVAENNRVAAEEGKKLAEGVEAYLRKKGLTS